MFEPQPHEPLFNRSMWHPWVFDLKIEIPKSKKAFRMHHEPQDRILRPLRNLGAPTMDVLRWAFKALDDSIQVTKGTVTTHPAQPTPADMDPNEPAHDSVMLVRSWVDHLKQTWPTGTKKGKKANPAPLDPPSVETGATDDWLSTLSGVRRFEKRICHTLMGLAMVRSQHRCYEEWQAPLPTIEQAKQPVPLIIPPGSTTSSSSAMTTSTPAATYERSIPTATAISSYQLGNSKSIKALTQANKDALAARFCFGPMLAFLTCGVRALMVCSDDRDLFGMGACFALLSLTDELAEDKPYKEDTWIWTNDYIMQLALKTLRGDEAKPDVLEIMKRLTVDYGHYWIRKGGLTQADQRVPRSLADFGAANRQLGITAEEGTEKDDGPEEEGGVGDSGDMSVEMENQM
jgi:hypothetical protein